MASSRKAIDLNDLDKIPEYMRGITSTLKKIKEIKAQFDDLTNKVNQTNKKYLIFIDGIIANPSAYNTDSITEACVELRDEVLKLEATRDNLLKALDELPIPPTQQYIKQYDDYFNKHGTTIQYNSVKDAFKLIYENIDKITRFRAEFPSARAELTTLFNDCNDNFEKVLEMCIKLTSGKSSLVEEKEETLAPAVVTEEKEMAPQAPPPVVNKGKVTVNKSTPMVKSKSKTAEKPKAQTAQISAYGSGSPAKFAVPSTPPVATVESTKKDKKKKRGGPGRCTIM